VLTRDHGHPDPPHQARPQLPAGRRNYRRVGG
jgi:hypothetical protein